MSEITIRTLDDQEQRLDTAAVEDLAANLQGQVLTPGAPGYEAARTVWNAMIDRRPALIARCTDTADVIQAMHFARTHGLLTAVRGGGHNIAGHAVGEGGFMIDLTPMRSVQVDPHTRMAWVGPGATLGALDHETQAFGLATPLGINSTTGIAGLTLGGGFGWLSRKYGMTIDNLLSADVVTAEGHPVHASEVENENLFWGLRGGGGNFGIVTRFEFQLHLVGPDVLSGLIVYPIAQAKSVLQQYRDFIAKAPDELSVWTVLRQAPPLPFLPAEVHGKAVVVLALLYAGNPTEGEPLIEPLRRFGTRHGEHVGVQPYTAWQQVFDPLLTPGARNYWKSHNFSRLDDRLFDIVIAHVEKLPSPQCEIFFGALGGATARPSPHATAYAHRDALFVMNFHGRWENPADDARCIGWARDFFNASAPFASGGVYVNFLTADEGDRGGAAYGPNHARLRQVKRKYDPENRFRINQNITPA